MTYPGDQGPAEPPRAALFTAMAARIDLNVGQGFGGAFVIVPPHGEPIELLLLNNKENDAVFWSLLKTTAEMALDELAQAQRKQQQGWGIG